MREISLSSEEVSTLNHERFYHPHPQVRRRMTVVWMRAQGRRQLDCAQIAGISERTVRRYIEGYEKNGLNWLREIRCKGQPSRLAPHAITLEAEFKQNPPVTVAAAAERVKELCGVEIRPTQMRAFLHSQDLKWRKIAAIPVPPKKTIEEHVAAQKEFLDTKLEPVLSAAQAGQGHVFFVDAAHFVLGMFLCCLWSQFRLFIRSSSGRQRFNVLGAWNAVTHQFISVCNTTAHGSLISQATY